MSSNIASPPSITKLDGSNYATWANLMRAVLCLYDLDGIINGTESAPANPEELANFTHRSSQAYSLIILSLKEPLRHLFDDQTTARELWDRIKDQYKKPSASAAFLSHQHLFRFTITEASPIRDQINTLQRYRQEAWNAGIKLTDQHFSFCILSSLPDSYLSKLLATTDLATITPDNITAKILGEEARRSSSASWSAFKGRPNRFQGECAYCKKLGHRAKDCRKQKRDKAE